MSIDHKLRVLLIDDDPDVGTTFEMACEDYWNIQTDVDPQKLLSEVHQLEQFDVVFLDLVFNENQSLLEKAANEPSPLPGLEILAWIRTKNTSIPVFLYSALLMSQYRPLVSKKYKNVFYLEKPILFDDDFRIQVEAIYSECKTAETN